jgi:hypothetical protein
MGSQFCCWSDGPTLKIAAAVRTSAILEAFDTAWTPGAFKRADVRLISGSNVTVAALTIRPNLKHAITLLPGSTIARVPRAFRQRIVKRPEVLS